MGSDVLSRIIEVKKDEVEAARRATPEAELRAIASERRQSFGYRGFQNALSSPGKRGANIIAEIKRASPSRGPIRDNLDPSALAAAYETGGAAALSVLTDRSFFQAKPGDLETTRSAVSLPVLRKDFTLTNYQIYEAAVMGADAILLIVRAVSANFLSEALGLCRELGMDALVEVHSEKEIETATRSGATLIGINNRDLSSFKTDIDTSLKLCRFLQVGQTVVSESGIRSRGDVETLLKGGVHNFLIGETLVRSSDPARELATLLGSA